MKYAVVTPKANGNCSADVPDLPGCVATAKRINTSKAQDSEFMVG